MMADKTQMARKELGDKVVDAVVAGIRSASAVDKWTDTMFSLGKRRNRLYLPPKRYPPIRPPRPPSKTQFHFCFLLMREPGIGREE